MGNIIEQTGKDYNDDLHAALDESNQIKEKVNQIQDQLDYFDSNFLCKLAEVNSELVNYNSKDFLDFLDELSSIFTEYADVFEELDRNIKSGL